MPSARFGNGQRDVCGPAPSGWRNGARWRLLALMLSLTAIAVNAGCSAQARPSLQVSGHVLIDAAGKPVRLLGVDRSGAEYPCIQGWGLIDGPTSRQEITLMTNWGINAVRIPLNEDCWLAINGVLGAFSGANYRAAIQGYVARLHEAGLYVILDLHWNAPGRSPATGQQPMADLDHAPAFWSSVAGTFKRDSFVLFDLYNEPRDIGWQCWLDGCMLPEGWRTAGMQTLVDAVRSTGSLQPIIATGINSGADLSSWLRYRPHDPANQLVAGLHVYNFASCATLACWKRSVAPVAHEVPVVATELGEGDCSHSFIDKFMLWADTAGVSYLGWAWSPFGCTAPALIQSWNGQPTPYGEGLRTHLIQLHFRPGSS
jgi:endoglucanase